MYHILYLFCSPTFFHLISTCHHITHNFPRTSSSSQNHIAISITNHHHFNMVKTTRGRKKPTKGQSGTKTNTKSATPTEASAASSSAATAHTPDDCTRVTRSFKQCYPRKLRQGPAFPLLNPGVATGGITVDDSSSSDESVAKRNIPRRGGPVKSNTVFESQSSVSSDNANEVGGTAFLTAKGNKKKKMMTPTKIRTMTMTMTVEIIILRKRKRKRKRWTRTMMIFLIPM